MNILDTICYRYLSLLYIPKQGGSQWCANREWATFLSLGKTFSCKAICAVYEGGRGGAMLWVVREVLYLLWIVHVYTTSCCMYS